VRIAVIGGNGFVGRNVMEGFDDCESVEQAEWVAYGLPKGIDAVIHLAANADVRAGWNHPTKDQEYGPQLTQQILEEMRRKGVRRIIFASTGSVYHPHDHNHFPDCPVHATSLYAASKIAAEQLIAAYASAGHVDATVLRFVSVLGPHYSHGLVKDFVEKLQADPTQLPIIAPGTSNKSYVHVSDVVEAMRTVLDQSHPFTIYNVGTRETAQPRAIAKWVIDEMGLDCPVVLEGETWVGDNPTIRLDTQGLRALGWRPKFTIEQAIRDTVRYLCR